MGHTWMVVLWPSFLVAIVAEGVFFSLFEPDILAVRGGEKLTPLAVYTLGFFFFWTCCALASWLTRHLGAPPPASTRE